MISFFLSVVGLVISVLISYSKWMYHQFSLAKGGPKKVAYKGFQYMKDRDTDTGVKIYWRCENRKCKLYLFSCTNQFSTKIRLNFDVIRRIFDQLWWSTKRRSRRNVVSTKCRVRPNAVSTKWFSTKWHGSLINLSYTIMGVIS